MASPQIGLEEKTKVFENLEEFAQYMNLHAGQHQWYMAGGCAAWLHIEAYPNKDETAYQTFRKQIFPGDIEGGLSEAGTQALSRLEMKVRLGSEVLDVHLQRGEPDNAFKQKMTFCEPLGVSPSNPVSAILVLGRKELITQYTRGAGDATKQEKRQLRVAIMTLMNQEKEISKDAVEKMRESAEPDVFQQVAAGVNLSHVETDHEPAPSGSKGTRSVAATMMFWQDNPKKAQEKFGTKHPSQQQVIEEIKKMGYTPTR